MGPWIPECDGDGDAVQDKESCARTDDVIRFGERIAQGGDVELIMRTPDEILLLICHPWGEGKCTLREWMRSGPGMRPLVAPAQAWDIQTGEELTLDVVARPYRNDGESIRMILEGEVADPWNRDCDLLREAYNLLQRVESMRASTRNNRPEEAAPTDTRALEEADIEACIKNIDESPKDVF